MKRNLFAAAAAGLLILLVTSGAASAPVPSAPASAPAASIVISGFDYSGDLTVKPGQEVTVTNMDPVPIVHTLTDKVSGMFDTGPIASAGGTATFIAPSTPGSYPFGCLFHLTMAGELVVQS